MKVSINDTKAFILMVWQLTSYVVIGLPIFMIIWPSAFYVDNSRTIYKLWLWYDRLICTCAHFTWMRTISGITGERAQKSLRYEYQERFIDWGARKLGDGVFHCYRAYLWEQSKGFTD